MKTIFPPATPTAVAGEASDLLDVYVDDSGSMKGFVSSNQSNYREVLRSMLLSATSARLQTSVYPLSSLDQPLKATPISEITSANFYTKQDTQLAALVDKIATREGHTAILVSDLVQSEPTGVTEGLVTALTKLAVKSPQMRLLSFRSDYKGFYCPEASRGITPKGQHAKTGGCNLPLDMSQEVPNGGRPFYLLVIAPDKASMSKVDDYLLKHFSRPPSNIFDPTEPAFEVTGVALSESTEAHPEWDLFSDYDLLDPSRRRFTTGYTLKNPVGSGDSTDLDLTLRLKSSLPLRRAEGLDLSGERLDWTADAASGKDAGPKITVRVPVKGSVPADGTSMRAVLTLRKPRSPYDLYRLQVLPGRGNLNVPGWVNEWSTEDDTVAANATQTFQLKTLVEDLENVISERQPCGEWLLVIKGGGR